MLAIHLSDEIEKRLDKLAKITGRTKVFYAREAILKHLEDLEDYYLCANTVDLVRKGQDALYSSEEIRKCLGLED